MRDIEEIIQSEEKYTDVIVQKRYNSKKNTVAYVTYTGKPRVFKWYAPAFTRNMETEYYILKKGSSHLNLPLPIDIDKGNNVLIMSYIPGKNLCDALNDENIPLDEEIKLITSLARWYARFHKFFKEIDAFRIRGDSVLRNFIVTDRIWSVDFEESRKGKPVEDIAGLCASLLSSDPMFTSEKRQLCELFIQEYMNSVEWKFENIHEEIAYALLEKIQWRPNDEEALRKYAGRIRSRGLFRK
jgi:tRNA A-37 threonylcarbamoyl transferase component Bud32